MIIGNVTRDIEMRYTPQGTAVANFSIATNRSWGGQDGGERSEEVEYHRIVAWGKLAEICQQLLRKGRKVFVEGYLKTRKWQTKEGQDRQVTEIVMENMLVLDSKSEAGEQSSPASRRDQKEEMPPVDTQSAEDISDDIPF